MCGITQSHFMYTKKKNSSVDCIKINICLGIKKIRKKHAVNMLFSCFHSPRQILYITYLSDMREFQEYFDGSIIVAMVLIYNKKKSIEMKIYIYNKYLFNN